MRSAELLREAIELSRLQVKLHGVVRGTRDIDIVPDPADSNLGRLAAVLRELDARQIGVDTEFLPIAHGDT